MTEHREPKDSGQWRRDIVVATVVVLSLGGAGLWTCFLGAFAGGAGRDWLLCSSVAWVIAGVLVILVLTWEKRTRRGVAGKWAQGVVRQDVKMEATPVTASGLLYLFGEEFVKPRGVGHALGRWCLVVVDLVLPSGMTHSIRVSEERLAYSGQEVDRGDLVIRLFEAAFVSLAQEGYISLATEKEEVTIAQERVGDDLPPSLERAIVEALSGDPKEDSVPLVVARLAGPLPTERPWRVLDFVKRQLVEAGYLGRRVNKRRFLPDEIRWWAHEEAIAPLAREVGALKTSLEAFASVNQDLHTMLVGAITDGLLMAG